MKIQKKVAISASTVMLAINCIPILADHKPIIQTDNIIQVCMDEIKTSADMIRNIVDNIEIEKGTQVYNKETNFHREKTYSYEVAETESQTKTMDEFIASYGQPIPNAESSAPEDEGIEQAAYEEALANYNTALAEYENASQMVENTKEIEVEFVEEVFDEEGSVTTVTRTDIQTIIEQTPAGDIASAQTRLDTASVELESARAALETKQDTSTEEAGTVYEIEFIEAAAQETSGTCGENLTWTLDDNNTLTISGSGDMEDYSMDNPSPWGTSVINVVLNDGLTSIGNSAFYNCNQITEISIPSSVTILGGFAFYGCSDLTSITILEGITSIGESTFENCTGLTSITIPDGVTDIGIYAFRGCTGLTSITIPDGITMIDDFVFQECIGLTSITIPDSVTSIGYSAFYNCTSIKSVTIPTGVISIGDYAFQKCSSLENITIPAGVTNIGNSAFYECTSLTSITLPAGVSDIAPYTFQGCTGLTIVNISDGVTFIGHSAFRGCSGLIRITIPESVTAIGSYAFYGCTGLTSIIISDGVISIGDYAFSNCSGLTSIVIPESVTSINSCAFSNCTNLADVTIPDCVETIGAAAFERTAFLENYPNDFVILGCGILYQYKGSKAEITIPAGVTSIGISAFSNCTSLKRIMISNSVTSIGSNAFYGCTGLIGVTILEGVTSIGESAFRSCTGLSSITIPDSVISIGDYAFMYCRALTNITIPESVTSMGYNTFYGCTGLKTAGPIGSDCDYEFGWTESLPNRAFESCTGLTNITIPDTVTYIGRYTFSGCTGLTSVTIPGSVTDIGYSAFYNCTGLQRVIIPGTIRSIESNAFKGCSQLMDVYYLNTEEEWDKIQYTFPSDVVIHFLYVKESRHTLSLDGNIGVNFYMEFSDDILSDETVRIEFTVEGNTVFRSIQDAGISGKYRRFSVDVTSVQMTSKISVNVIFAGINLYEEEYSAKDYCDTKLADASLDTKLRNLIEALLNYGGYSQIQFRYHTDNLANKDLDDTDVSDVTADMLKPYESVKTGSVEGLVHKGSTLTLDTLTTIKHYFTVENGHSIDEYTFMLGDTELTPVLSGTMYYVEIPNIASNALDTTYTVTCGNFSIAYSALSYAFNQLNKTSGNVNLQNACRALYKYNQTADSYFAG